MPLGPFCKCGKILDIGSLSAAKTGRNNVWLRGGLLRLDGRLLRIDELERRVTGARPA